MVVLVPIALATGNGPLAGRSGLTSTLSIKFTWAHHLLGFARLGSETYTGRTERGPADGPHHVLAHSMPGLPLATNQNQLHQ